jgi:glycosyltransferase-like protein LARGE
MICVFVLFLFIYLFSSFSLFLNPPLQSGDDDLISDVTLVTHLSVERISALENILTRWEGPISVAFWLKNTEDVIRIADIEQMLKQHKGKVSYCFFKASKYTYPANILRNRALQLVDTKLVLLLDADFVPSRDLYKYLKGNFDQYYHGKNIYIVPAFQFAIDNPSYTGDLDGFFFPEKKADLLERIEDGSILPMFAGIDDTPSIRATNLPVWYVTDEPYTIKYEEDYEPYIVAPTALIPKFDERFVYYGYDKIQHIYHLYYSGFRFNVLPNHFIIHYPHHRSNWGEQQQENSKKVKMLYQQFKHELKTGKIQ